MPKTDKTGIKDDVKTSVKKADDPDAGIVGNEQWADAPGVKGPAPEQWPVEERDMRLAVNKDRFEPDPEEEGYVKGPDPAQHPDRDV